MFSNDQMVGNNAVYAGSEIARDKPFRDGDSPCSSCVANWLTRSSGNEGGGEFCTPFLLLIARDRP
jgi:hypothetical protein